MLVYCTHLPMLPSTPTDDVLGPISAWLSVKARRSIAPTKLTVSGSEDLAEQGHLAITAHQAGTAEYVALRYSHPDKFIVGREWITEIGLRRDGGELGCSILLRTDEKSALVPTDVETTRPIVVEKIAERCRLAAHCPGGKSKPLTLDDVEAFDSVIHDPERAHPIVQISTLQDGSFAVEPERLASLLIGVADVVAIPAHVDTFALEHLLGGRYSCYHGAVNIVWPIIRVTTGPFAPATRIMAAELLEMRSKGMTAENQVLAIVCHRTNAPYSRRHLTPEAVHSISLRHALDEAKVSGAKSDADFAELVHRVDHDQQEEIQRLGRELAAKEADAATLYSEIDTLQATVDSLKQNITALSQSSRTTASIGLAPAQRKSIVEAVGEKFTLTDALELVQILFPDRVAILDDAWGAARKADQFNYPHRAFALMAKLCGEYWDGIANGRSDGEARACLGSAFSARESETVEGNKRAKKLRTFTYKGKSVEMMMHLKIGVKPSRHETWRCHFEWDAVDKRIVIGHCGEHLDHN